MGHSWVTRGSRGWWPRARAIILRVLSRRLLNCGNSRLAVAGGSDGGRDMGHSCPAAPGPGDGSCCLHDHVGGGLRRPVGGLGQDAGVGVGGGDDAGMADRVAELMISSPRPAALAGELRDLLALRPLIETGMVVPVLEDAAALAAADALRAGTGSSPRSPWPSPEWPRPGRGLGDVDEPVTRARSAPISLGTPWPGAMPTTVSETGASRCAGLLRARSFRAVGRSFAGPAGGLAGLRCGGPGGRL